MFRLLALTLLLFISAAPLARAGDACTFAGDTAAVTPVLLKRGVNLSRWWEDDTKQSLSADDIKKLAELNFDFVRLPLTPAVLSIENENQQKEKLAQLRCDLVALLKANFSIVIDLHAPEMFQRNLALASEKDAAKQLSAVWKRLQPAIDGLPRNRILLGLYNEPHIEAEPWWRVQGLLVKDLRTVYPGNTLVVTAGPDGGPWSLANMEPYTDKNIVYDFHFYQPMQFTHHGADWLDSYKTGQKDVRILYPSNIRVKGQGTDPSLRDYIATNWNHIRLAGYLEKAIDWGKAKNVRVACLEFGVYKPYVDNDSRARWLQDVHKLLEKNHIAWAMWEYRGGFGLLDDNNVPDKDIIKALGLDQKVAP